MFGRQDAIFGTEERKATSVGGTLKRFWDYFGKYSIALVVTAVLILGWHLYAGAHS